jgi:hypothetical protein
MPLKKKIIKKMNKNKLVGGFIIGTFVMLYILVSLISTIHVIDFFELSNPRGMAIALAVAFELGAAASLASLITLDKMNKTLVWALFIAITAMQMQGNMYYAFKNLSDYETWSQLFNLIEEEPLYQKRILAFVSGAILPLIALGFIKSLVDYIKPEGEIKEETIESPGKLNSSDEEVIEDDYDWASLDGESDEDLIKDFDDIEGELSELDDELINEYHENMAADREKYNDLNTLEDKIEDSEEWDEDHALDVVMNDMVEDLDLEDILTEDEIQNYKELKQESNKNFEVAVEAIKPKQPIKDVDAAYKFGTNLYNTTMQKLNSDHLPKPSVEQISKAYKNLGLVKNNDKE